MFRWNVLVAILSTATYAEGAKSSHSKNNQNIKQRQPKKFTRGMHGSADKSTDRERGVEAKNVAESREMNVEEGSAI